MSYYVITSKINNKTNTESFFIDQEMEIALDTLDKITEKYFNGNYYPMDDGIIGYYNSKGDRVYLEEKI